MRRIHVSLLAIALCALFMSPALTAAQSTIDKVTSATVKEKDAAVAHGKKLVGDMDVQIKALETQVSKDTSSAKADGQRQLNDLKAKRAATGKKLDELGKASEQNWDTTKKGFADAFTDLQKSFEKVAANIKK
jgi:hypothetical protein